MRLPTTRAMMSFGPPGGNGTISRIDFSGKSAPCAKAGSSRQNPIVKSLKIFTAILPIYLRRNTIRRFCRWPRLVHAGLY